MEKNKVIPVHPKAITIAGVGVLERTVFNDRRGFLIETFAKEKENGFSVYSYCSLTQPGFARDEDKFHFHQFQQDRFTIIFGTMWILLYDARPQSSTYGKLEVVEVNGGDPKIQESVNQHAYTITIPEMVYHGIKNPGPSWAILINHPTKEYSSQDEGRLLFSDVTISSLNKEIFSWEKVKKEKEK